MNETVTVVENGRPKIYTRRELAVRALSNNAIKGNVPAARTIIEFESKNTPTEPAPEPEKLSAEEDEAFKQFLKRLEHPDDEH